LKPEELRNFLIEKFHLALARESMKEEELHEKGHPSVTGLVYDCLRRCYYQITYPDIIIDPKGAIRTWIGRKLHETSILEGEMELELEYKGIRGRIDEYKNGILLDKKTTRHIPREPYEHHIRQIEYYWVLCERNGYHVDIAAIMYIDVDSAEIEVFPITLERSLEEIENEMLEKYKIIMECLKTGILPPRKMRTWSPDTSRMVCQYCSYYGICMRENYEDPRWKALRKTKKEDGKEEI